MQTSFFSHGGCVHYQVTLPEYPNRWFAVWRDATGDVVDAGVRTAHTFKGTDRNATPKQIEALKARLRSVPHQPAVS